MYSGFWAGRLVPAVLITVFVSLPLSAQEGDKKVEPSSSQKGSPDEMPTYTGKGKVTEAVDTVKGAIFDIGGGVTLLLPRGLPVGHSRLLTLKTNSSRPASSQIQPRFQAIGPTLHFDGALNAPKRPIVLALSMKRSPEKAGFKLVLAIEEAGLCTKENKSAKLPHGLCSIWRTVEAEYDSAGNRILAKLSSTGGLRLQFGLVPES